MKRRIAVLTVVMLMSCSHMRPVYPPPMPVPTPCDDDVVVANVVPCPND